MAPRVFVTGATGFLGRNLVRLLDAEGIETVAFHRPGSDLEVLRGLRHRAVAGELTSAEDLRRGLSGCEAAFHLAACTSLLKRDRRRRAEVNVAGVRALLEALAGLKVRLVHCSTVGTVGFSGRPDVLDESSPFDAGGIDYFLSKRRGEELVLEAARRGLDAVVVNPGTLIGARGMRGVQKTAFKKAAAGGVLAYPPGGSCFTPVEDAARGLVAAWRKGRSGERYILGGANLGFREYFSKVAALGGARGPLLPLPGALLPTAGCLVESMGGSIGRDTGRLAAGFGYYSSRKAERELEYALTPIDEALRGIYEALGAGE
ncbi:MAG: NAD-dependent epimerase/dehydratase family protein [Elusimicrobia bacterium]|nr:NAD-dependent epimerase/dehydratase family protein [Elusimicrobiota bacterium]